MPLSVLPQRDRLKVQDGRLYIDGTWTETEGGTTFDQIHPATNEVVARIVEASATDVDRAVHAARRAFDEGPWPKVRARERRQLMQKLVEAIYAHADELSWLQTLDNGIPLSYSLNTRVSAKNAADYYDHYAGWIDKITGETFPQFTESSELQYLTFREPVGVVAAIIPWNAPLMMFALKTAPALATGCTVIMKPSEHASLCALRLAELIDEVGLPPGVFQLLTGGPSTGDAMVKHPGIDKITFTGSQAVGEYILSQSGKGIKRTTLELGGKSAAIVYPDAPTIEFAANTIMSMCSMFLSGQLCSTTSRALVHESVVDEFVHYARKQTEGVRFGDPFDLKTTSMPMINRKQLDKVIGFIESGKEEGARLAFGGDRPTGELDQGNWINPTLFTNVNNTMRIAREEIFGPVLSVMAFKTEDEAVRIANDSPYGLSGGVYTTNLARAFRTAKAMRTGSVGVNGYSVMPNAPSGGVKSSGLGREGGWATIEAFTELKTIMINMGV